MTCGMLQSSIRLSSWYEAGGIVRMCVLRFMKGSMANECRLALGSRVAAPISRRLSLCRRTTSSKLTLRLMGSSSRFFDLDEDEAFAGASLPDSRSEGMTFGRGIAGAKRRRGRKVANETKAGSDCHR